MAEVWHVLDTEFAQEQLSNNLPNLEAALQAVYGLDHLQSPDRVNVLISRFDDRTLHDWD